MNDATSKTLTIRDIWRDPILCVACFMGFGNVPKAPGTLATFLAIPLAIAFAHLTEIFQLALITVFFLLGCIICHHAAIRIGTHDPACIVWDEIVGYCIAMAFLPLTLATIATTFILFRLADIFKPWPISWIEKRIPGGAGIMLDDALAGLATNLVVQLLVGWNIVGN